MPHLSLAQLLKETWQLWRNHWKPLTIFGGAIAILSFVKDGLDQNWTLLGGGNTLSEIGSALIGVALFVGSFYLISISLDIVRNRKIVFHIPIQRLLSIILASLLLLVLAVITVPLSFIVPGALGFVGAIVLGGSTLGTALVGVAVALGFIVVLGWIYILVRWSLWVWAIIDRGGSLFKSLRHSWSITRNHFWFLILAAIVLTIINALGIALFFVGSIITLPLSVLAYSYLYQHLQGPSADHNPSLTTTKE